MKCIVVTRPDFFEGEAAAIETMLASGVIDRVHLRKPGAQECSVRRLIEAVSPSLRGRLSLHDCHVLAAEYGAGIHLNARNSVLLPDFSGIVSRSCHSIHEAMAPAHYRFLSPVFNSISKPGYQAAFNLEELVGKVDDSFVALGGVVPERLPMLDRIGFGGAAFLGYIWDGNLNEKLENVAVYNSQTRAVR